MTSRALRVVVLAMSALTTMATSAVAQSHCSSAKVKAVGKTARCRLALEAREAAGKPKNPARVQRCEDEMVAAFSKYDAAYTDCRVTGEVSWVIPVIDTFVNDVDTALSVGLPNKCQAAKLKATGKKAKCFLDLYARTLHTLAPLDPAKVQRCHDKHTATFAQEEAKLGCATTGDADAIEGDVDIFTTDVQYAIVEIDPPPPTTTSTTITSETCCGSLPSLLAVTVGTPSGAATGNVFPARCVQGANDGAACSVDADCTGGGLCRGHLDAGALYLGDGGPGAIPMPLMVPDGGRSYFKVVSCTGIDPVLTPLAAAQVPPGPSTPAGTPTYGERHCTSPGCLFGPPLGIVAPHPGANLCVIAAIDDQPDAGTGSLTCNVGKATLNLPQTWSFYLTGPFLGSQPCPTCVGNTCVGGPRDGQPCTPETGGGEPTSHDCPPPPSSFVGSIPVGVTLTTDNQTATSIATGAQANAFCGYCFDVFDTYEAPPRPCTSNAECTNGSFTSCRQRSSGAFHNASATTLSETGAAPGASMFDGAAHAATLVSLFCVPPSQDILVDAGLLLPGPGAASFHGTLQLIP